MICTSKILFINGILITSGYSYTDYPDYITVNIDSSEHTLQYDDEIIIEVIPYHSKEDWLFLDSLLTLEADDNENSILLEKELEYFEFSPSVINNIKTIDKSLYNGFSNRLR